MSYWEWDPKLNTGVDVIDGQHRRIVEFINTLHDIIETHEDEKAGEVLNDLVEYTLTHFAFEEELMIQSGYPLELGHKAEHEEFVRRINDYQERYNSGNDSDVAKELMAELKHWLASHIRFEDHEYVALVQKKFNSGWVKSAVNRLFG